MGCPAPTGHPIGASPSSNDVRHDMPQQARRKPPRRTHPLCKAGVCKASAPHATQKGYSVTHHLTKANAAAADLATSGPSGPTDRRFESSSARAGITREVEAGHDGKISILKIGEVRMEGHVGVPPVAFFPQNCAWKDISLYLRAHEMPGRAGQDGKP